MKKIVFTHQDHIIRIKEADGKVEYVDCEQNMHEHTRQCSPKNCLLQKEIAQQLPL